LRSSTITRANPVLNSSVYLLACDGGIRLDRLNNFVQFLYLQVLDILTTVAFLLNGVREANPVVRFALEAAPSPFLGLLVVKLVAVALAIYCVRRARLRLLARVNWFFAALVAWNLFVLILSSPGLGIRS